MHNPYLAYFKCTSLSCKLYRSFTQPDSCNAETQSKPLTSSIILKHRRQRTIALRLSHLSSDANVRLPE